MVSLARESLAAEGESPDSAGLHISVIPRRKVVRLAYDAPFTYGRRGAHWYGVHVRLAESLSAVLHATVHAYVFDPDELEQVQGFGDGRRVGGERLRYEDAEAGELELTESQFAALQQKWPLGHLAYVFGVTRKELLRLPRSQSVLVSLDGRGSPTELTELWTSALAASAGP